MATFRFLLLFFLLTGSSSSPFISNMFVNRRLSGRFLLQEIKDCPVDFEHKNYTAFSRNCNESHFQSDQCCAAFKELTCPNWEILSDTKYNCASTLFSNINLHTNNTSEHITNFCHEGDNGLDCGPILNATTPSSPTKKSTSGARAKFTQSSMLKIMAGLLQHLF